MEQAKQIAAMRSVALRRGEMAAAPQEAVMRAQAEAIAATPAPSERTGPKLQYPVLFGCAGCDKLFPSRNSCDAHAKSSHDVEGPAKVLFHPRATEAELKACLFANLPWTDRALLSPTVHPDDMDLCRVTKTLVLREPEDHESLSAW